MASSLMAGQSTLFLRNPTTSLSHNRQPAVYSLPSAHPQYRPPKLLVLPKPLKSKISASTLSHNRRPAVFSLPSAHAHPQFRPPKLLILPKPSKSKISASISTAPINPSIEPSNNSDPARDFLSGSTRTVTTLVAVSLIASKFFAHGLFSLAVQLKEPLLYTAGPAFFAAARDHPSGSLNTPFTVVAAGMAKWLDLYSGVLMVRVMLSWFPNIPWDKQPLCAIRDLCDPYLNLFRNIIPPILNSLDVSPLLAFGVLGVLGSILNTSRQSF